MLECDDSVAAPGAGDPAELRYDDPGDASIEAVTKHAPRLEPRQ